MKKTPLKCRKTYSLKKSPLVSKNKTLTSSSSTLKRNSTLKASSSLKKTTVSLAKSELKKQSDKAKELWIQARERIIKRDNGKCRVCGKPGTQVHHIHLRSKRKDLLYHDNNLILLCDKHHFHQSIDKYEEQTKLIADALHMTVEELLEFAEN